MEPTLGTRRRDSDFDVVGLLHQMVSIRSESGSEGNLARFLVSEMRAAGLEAHVDEVGNVIGAAGHGDRHVVLLGHLDTVPGGPPVAIRDGRLYGRGSVDAKGPLAVFVAVVARLARSLPAGVRLTVCGAVEEEVASSKGARFVADRWQPEACVIGEPSGTDAVALGYKGRLFADVEHRRPTTHSAAPVANAAELVVSDWNRIREFAQQHDDGVEGLFGRLQTELASIASFGDGDLDGCRATFGFRLPPDLPPEALSETLHESLGEGLVRLRGATAPWTGDRSSPLALAFRRAIRSVTGHRPRLKHKTGTSDMNIVGPRWRCPILAYGPGDSRLDHTPDEHVEIDHLRTSVTVLETALASYLGSLTAGCSAEIAPATNPSGTTAE